LAVLPYLQRAGFTFTFLAPAAGPLAEQIATLDVQQAAWSPHDDHGTRRALDSLRKQLQAAIVCIEPEIVHANSLSMTRVAGPVVASLGAAGVGHLRDIVRLSAAAVRDVNRMPHLIAVSHATRSFHVNQGVDASRMQVCYNGVDMKQFRPRPATGMLHRQLQLPHDALLVGTIGQIGLRKGTDVFVELAVCVAQRRSDIHFLDVGQRTSNKKEAIELEATLRRRANETPLQGHIHFLGTRRDVPDLLPDVDIVVHAARQEPLGRVLLESAAAAKAIVATDVGGTREIFPGDSDAAAIVPKCDVDGVLGSELLEQVVRLLDDPPRRRQLGTAARRRIEQEFNVAKAAQQLVDAYQRVSSLSR